jgi:hypothetical protein
MHLGSTIYVKSLKIPKVYYDAIIQRTDTKTKMIHKQRLHTTAKVYATRTKVKTRPKDN